MERSFKLKMVTKIIFSTIVGTGLGFSYFYFIGCNGGSCAITSNPINSMSYGAFMGFAWYLPDVWLRRQK